MFFKLETFPNQFFFLLLEKKFFLLPAAGEIANDSCIYSVTEISLAGRPLGNVAKWLFASRGDF